MRHLPATTAVLAAAATIAGVGAATAAQAQTDAAPQAAARYVYQPGHPIAAVNGPGTCTGSYIITVNGRKHMLTSGSCVKKGMRIYNPKTYFGTVTRTETKNLDAALIKPDRGIGLNLTPVNPLSHQSPGKVVGYVRNSQLRLGSTRLGYAGIVTGGQEGTFVTWQSVKWPGRGTVRLGCLSVPAEAKTRDIGGPVWQPTGNGEVKAVGMTAAIGHKAEGDKGPVVCFMSMEDILKRFKATLPTQPSAQRSDLPEVAAAPEAAPQEVELQDAQLTG